MDQSTAYRFDDEELALMREAYRAACITIGIDPSERELNVRMRIVEGIMQGLVEGEYDADVLSARGLALSTTQEAGHSGLAH